MKNVHFAIPEIYGETLSYYELLRKLVDKTNELIDNYNTVPEQIAEEVKNLDASQLFSTVLNQLIHSIATDNTKSANAVMVYKKHDLLYATFNETVNLYESMIDFTTGAETELIVGTNIREVNISELFIELRKLIDINKNNIEAVTAVANENGTEISTIHNDITSIENKNTEQDNEISTLRTMISSPYNFKGDVASISALPASGAVNDTYYVQDVKYKVTWTGSAWVQSSLSEADYQTELSKLKDDFTNHFEKVSSKQLFDTNAFLFGKILQHSYNVSTPDDMSDDENWVTTNIIEKPKGSSLTFATNITNSGIVALGYVKNSDGNYVRSDYYSKVTSGENYNTLTFAEDTELIRISILKSQYDAINNYQNGIYICEETKWSADLSREYINETRLINTKVKEEDIITENPINYNGNEVNVFFYGIACGDSLTEGTFNTESGYENHKQYAYPMIFTKKTGVTLRNFGAGGSTAKSWYERYQNVEFPIYDFAIIAFGVNDLLQGVENTTITYLTNIVDKLKSKNPKVKCFIATVNKAYKSASANYDTLNDNIRNFANTTEGCYLLDIAKYGLTEDGTNFVNGHLTAIGYNELAREFANLISWNIQNNMSDFADIQFSGTTYTSLPTD